MYKKGSKFIQGRYKPKFPEKYIGDVTNIIYRSSWELRWCKFFDFNKSVISWSSESLIIPYQLHDGSKHRYFPDFIVEYVDKNNNKQKLLIEIKPYNQTQLPKKKSKFYGDKMDTFMKNVCKWEQAKEFARKNNMQFTILTEKSLGKIPI